MKSLTGKSKPTVRVRRTPNCLHQYTATMRGKGAYGWGNTPAEARAKFMEHEMEEERATKRPKTST